MSHTAREKQKLIGRVRRIRGQVEALERALEAESECADVMHLIAACRGAMNGLLAKVLEDHIRSHLVDRHTGPALPEGDASEQLIALVHSYFK